MNIDVMAFAMNAFIYAAPVYCAARAVADLRSKQQIWAIFGAIGALVLLAPLFSAFAFPDSEMLAWLSLGIVIIGSIGVTIYVAARTIRDFIEGRIAWGAAGTLTLILLFLPWLWTAFAPPNEVTIG